ncbi:Enoyl-CoA hydratase [hydrothermal vent metagenome]|uniref:Enoyl-CoA hydratase n=1 Tax=hydrothermal vent metagenome TaxID=652676 RepID=A0A3B1DLU5_9ZZZZ
MADPLVSYTEDGPIAIVTISNPPKNVLTIPLIEAFETVVEDLAKKDKIKAIVITGSGPIFIAGADIKVIASIKSPEAGEALAKRGQALFNKIEQMQKVVIAAINGYCLGGGMELAMACHLRVLGDRVRMGQPEINLGIIPGFGGTQRLPRIVGQAKAIELILSGDMINAEEAKRIGLANKVVPEGEVLKQALGLAKKIASKSRCAIEAIMKAIEEGMNEPLSIGLSREAELFGKICQTEDMREGITAFLEKRQPKFQDK